MYIIEKITDKNGNERTDGRYPLRKGCTVSTLHLRRDNAMILDYIKDNLGVVKSGHLITSVVEDWELDEKCVVVYTLNSVYYLRDINK